MEPDAVEQTLTQREWRKLNRRELLKLTPIVLAGAFVSERLNGSIRPAFIFLLVPACV